MLNPSNLDEVSVQATHLESRGKNFDNDNFVQKSSKVVETRREKKTSTVKKVFTCSHYDKKGHDEEHCWRLHPALKPKWAQK